MSLKMYNRLKIFWPDWILLNFHVSTGLKVLSVVRTSMSAEKADLSQSPFMMSLLNNCQENNKLHCCRVGGTKIQDSEPSGRPCNMLCHVIFVSLFVFFGSHADL